MPLGNPETLDQRLRNELALGLAGDTLAYESFLRSVSFVLRSYLTRASHPATRDREKIEDLVQETLLNIHQKCHLYRNGQPILPWLRAIARYRLIDSIRSSARRPRCVAWTPEYDNQFAAPECLWEEDPSELLPDLLSGLSARQRRVLFLAKVQEMPLAEIAQQMKMSLSSVKVGIHRALIRLRKSAALAKEVR